MRRNTNVEDFERTDRRVGLVFTFALLAVLAGACYVGVRGLIRL